MGLSRGLRDRMTGHIGWSIGKPVAGCSVVEVWRNTSALSAVICMELVRLLTA